MTSVGRSRLRTWLVIGGLALGVRLLAASLTGAFQHPQLFEYDEIARALLAGDGFVYHHLGGVAYRVFTTPLYIWCCAGLYWASG